MDGIVGINCLDGSIANSSSRCVLIDSFELMEARDGARTDASAILRLVAMLGNPDARARTIFC